MELVLRGLIVLIILIVACAALIGAGDLFPSKEFSGAIIGAAGTVFAGWLAWQAVYRQSRVQSAQAAIELLKIVEEDARQIAEENNILSAVWSVTAELRQQLSGFVVNGRPVSALQEALTGFQSTHPANLNILTTRVTLDQEMRLACMELGARLTLVQAKVQIFLEDVKTLGKYTDTVVNEANNACGNDLGEIVVEIRRLLDAANAEEEVLRDRARRLRRAANDLPD